MACSKQQHHRHAPSLGSSSFNSSCMATPSSFYMQQPPYYVQSPARISSVSNLDADKASGPLSSAPSSPLSSKHYSYPAGEAAGGVSSKLGSRVAPQPFSTAAPFANYKWTSVDEEVVLPPNSEPRHLEIRRQYVFWCWVALLTAMSIVLCAGFVAWLVRRPYSPQLLFEGARFSKISVSPGADQADVPTYVLTLDSTLNINLYNPSKYFNMHYTPTAFTLFYLEIPIAHGQLPQFTQPKQSREVLHVDLKSMVVPLYGAGPSLEASLGDGKTLILTLEASLSAHANLLSSILKRHFRQSLNCELVVDGGGFTVLSKSCSSS